jgi:flagellar basal body-associated protein FliL
MGAPAAGLPAPELGRPDAPSGRRRIVKIVIWIVVVVALAVGGWFGWHTFNHPAAAPATHSQSAPAAGGALVPSTTAPGTGGPHGSGGGA